MEPLTINFAGVIADHQRFLDGARSYTIEAENQPATGWRMALSFRWDVEDDAVDEGDLTLVDPVGAELYGTLTAGTAAEITDAGGDANAAQLDLTFEVTGGEGGYASAAGTVSVTGTIAGEGPGTGGSFEGEGALLTARISVSGAEEGRVWGRAPEADIPTGTPRRDGEPRG